MNKETILVGIITLLVGGIIGFSLPRSNDNEEYKRQNSIQNGMHMMEDGSLMRHDAMGGGMGMMGGGMMNMMVESEKEFIEEMIPHHQEAVDTAKEVLARGGTTPQIKTLAENIVKAQEKEIADMKSWYETWYGTPYKDTGRYVPMMRNLKNLSGKELDKAFLSDMIMHHMDALMMAQSVTPYIEHEEMTTLTNNIASTQSKEISEMRLMLRGL